MARLFIQTIWLLLLPPVNWNFNNSKTYSPVPIVQQKTSTQGFGQRIKANGFQNRRILSPKATAHEITQSFDKDKLQAIKTVVIDAGHGGYDPGTSGKYTKEKTIALAIALKLEKSLQAEHPEVKFILTRNKDVFIPLHERAKIANDAKADLFISIHCNAISGSTATAGTETYVLGNHRLEDNLQIAMRENSSILFEQDYESIYNFDPNSPEGYIIMSMYQDVYQEQSIKFAQKVEDQMKDIGSKKSRGVKQAGFIVLKETAMPSVLIETGFLTNKNDETYLRSALGQQEIANKIADAFDAYNQEIIYLTRAGKSTKAIPNPTPQTVSPAEANPIVKSTKTEQQAEQLVSEFRAKSGQTDVKPVEVSSSGASAVQIKVQLAASTKRLELNVEPWSNVNGAIEVVQEGGFYKYLIGNYHSAAEAEKQRLDYHRLGFTGAFTVYYLKGKRIKQSEAKALLNQ